jgi:hypothetical protein
MSAGFVYYCYCGGGPAAAGGGGNRVTLLCAGFTVQYGRCHFMFLVLPYVCLHVCMRMSTYVYTYTYIWYVVNVCIYIYLLYIHIVSCDTGCAAELGTRSCCLHTHLQLHRDPWRRPLCRTQFYVYTYMYTLGIDYGTAGGVKDPCAAVSECTDSTSGFRVRLHSLCHSLQYVYTINKWNIHVYIYIYTYIYTVAGPRGCAV